MIDSTSTNLTVINSTTTNSTISSSVISNVLISSSTISNSNIINTEIDNAVINSDVIYSGTITPSGTTTPITITVPTPLNTLINYVPIASFSVATNGLDTTITDYSTDSNEETSFSDSWVYNWNFGDGATSTFYAASTNGSTSHTYATSGTYMIVLTLTDALGESSSTSTLIIISNTTYYTLTYVAGTNGSITGSSTQIIASGSDGSSVTAVADSGYHFVDWDDASTANPRTDTSVSADHTFTANFAVDSVPTTYYPSSGGGGGAPIVNGLLGGIYVLGDGMNVSQMILSTSSASTSTSTSTITISEVATTTKIASNKKTEVVKINLATSSENKISFATISVPQSKIVNSTTNKDNGLIATVAESLSNNLVTSFVLKVISGIGSALSSFFHKII